MEAIGKVNRYECAACKQDILTINLNVGVTPFGIKCPVCGSFDCTSTFYDVNNRKVTVSHAWYRPNKEELAELEKECPGGEKHVRSGVLVLKKLEDVVKEDWSFPEWNEYTNNYYGEEKDDSGS